MLDLPQSQTEGEAYLWLHASDADPVEVKGKKSSNYVNQRARKKNNTNIPKGRWRQVSLTIARLKSMR